MRNRGRIAHELIIVMALLLGSCMEKPDRVPAHKLAAQANANALLALRQAQELDARLRRLEEQLGNRASAS